MDKFDIGEQIVTRTLRDKTPKAFLDRGWDLEWMNDQRNPPRLAVFPEPHGSAWRSILSHWERYGKTPQESVFLYENPGYKLPDDVASPEEIIDLASGAIREVAIEDGMGDMIGLLKDGDYPGFADRMQDLQRYLSSQERDANRVNVWDEGGQDVDTLLNRRVKFGIGTGIPEMDGQEGFAGFQPGNLITYLGRAKAGKTSMALLSAMDAAIARYKRVLIVTVEIDAQNMHDRLDAYAARVSLSRLVAGKMTDAEKDKVRRVYAEHGEYEPSIFIVQPTEKYTVTDLETAIDRYQPDYVVIDGFYFMTDRITGKPGGSWEGHDNLAGEIKRVAMKNNVTILTTHQVREKQLGGKRGAGIDDGAMMGGTGLIMASDMVIGIDIDDDHINKLSCTRSRTGYLRAIRGQWDWEKCTFETLDDEYTADE